MDIELDQDELYDNNQSYGSKLNCDIKIKIEPGILMYNDENINEKESMINKNNCAGLTMSKKRTEDENDHKCNLKCDTELTENVKYITKDFDFIDSEESILKEETDKYCDCSEEDDIEFCSKYVSLGVINEKAVLMGESDRAALTVPKDILDLRRSSIHILGIFTQICLSKGVQLGPFEGQLTKVKEENGEYNWKLVGGRLENAGDEAGSNYLQYINNVSDVSKQNLEAFQYKGELYFRTCRNIKRGEELLVYFGGCLGDSYFKPHGEKPTETCYSCEYCHIGLRLKEYRDKHQKICIFRDSQEKINDGSGFATSSDQHTCTNSENKPVESSKIYSCSCCLSGPNNKIILDSLRSDKHKYKIVYKCTDCEYETYFTGHMSLHRKKKHEVKKFICEYCGYEANSKKLMYNHSRKHKKEDDNMFHCTDCDYKSYSKKNLDQHRIKHKKKTHKCSYCEYKSYYKRDATNHTKLHEQKDAFKCTDCKYVTFAKGLLRKHRHVVHDRKDLFKCTNCKYETMTRDNLDRHRIIVHKEILY